MLDLSIDVVNGVILIELQGQLDGESFNALDRELNYLIYKQGMHYYLFNFSNLDSFDSNSLSKLQCKLVEIFLNCGKVAMCGINNILRKKLGFKEQVFYVNNEREALKYFGI